MKFIIKSRFGESIRNISSLSLIFIFILAGCGSNLPAISIENVDQVSWIKSFPVSNNGTFGDVGWSHAEDGQLFVSGAMKYSDGSWAGYVYEWNVDFDDGQVHDWRTSKGKKLPGLPIYSLAISPDGRRIALGSLGRVAMIWDLDYLPGTENVFYLEGHTEDVIQSVAWSPDGKLLASGGNDKTVRIWNVDSDIMVQGSPIEELMMFETVEKINCVSFSPNGKLIVIGTDAGIASIDIETQTLVLSLSGAPIAKLGESIAWSSDGSLLALGSSDGKVFILPFAGDKFDLNAEVHDISAKGVIRDLDFSPDGTMLVISFSNLIEIWDLGKKLLFVLSAIAMINISPVLRGRWMGAISQQHIPMEPYVLLA